MVSIQTAPELSIRQYVASLDLNPDNVFYQRVRSNNVTTAGAQWQITSPNKRSLLLSYAAIDWQPLIGRYRADGVTGQNFDDSGDQFSMKPLLPFTQAMTSQTLSINGNSLTMSQPRRFMECLSRMCVTSDESKTCFETAWWDKVGGNYPGNRIGIDTDAAYVDTGLSSNENLMKRKFFNRGNPLVLGAPLTLNAAGAGNNVGVAPAGITISHQEPLIVPPFNPYAKVARDIPGYLPWGKMSAVIPNIDRLEIDIQFNPSNITAGAMFYRYAHADTNNEVKNLIFTDLAADLLLYWYEVPTDMSIPRSVDLQTWNLREFQSPVTGGTVVVGTRPANAILTDLLQLRSAPSFIILHAQRRHDEATYRCRSMQADDDYLGTGAAGSASLVGAPANNANHSLDPFMEIVDLNIVLGDRPNVVSTQFTQRELYYLTLKNCKLGGFSLPFDQWAGPYCQNIRMAGQAVDDGALPSGGYEHQQSKCFIVLQPKDIAEKISSGIFFPTSLQFTVNVRAKDGACGLRGGVHLYDLFTHVVVAKHMLRLEPDRAQYQEQSMTLDAAEAALKPGIVGTGGAVTGGALASLRDRVATSSGGLYQSRF